MIGQNISHYRIVDKLGSGGMGTVYKAEDANLDRTVALKFLASHLLESEEHKQRFLREAKAAASLDHPNICTVHEVGESDGRVFIVMSYIDGPELSARIKEGPQRLDDALNITIQAAEGLNAAHQKGIIHRDVKSSNLILTATGQVKIMDFGLAQLAGWTRLTRTDTILGTPAYMSPEQASGAATDKRTDIWSLGVVLYEMVTGRLPFLGDREHAMIHSVIHAPYEPITAIRVGVPMEFDRIVGKALAKNPAERYQHLDDMLVDLRALRGSLTRTSGTCVSVRPPAQWHRISFALSAVVAAAGLFGWLFWRTPNSAVALRAVPLTTFPGQELYPTLSPDGNYVAFTWNGPTQENNDIYVQLIGSGSPLRVTTDLRNDMIPVWSPDGRWIAFLREASGSVQGGIKTEVRLIPPLGGPERRLADIEVTRIPLLPLFLNWCPDSKCLVVTDSQGEGKPLGLFVVSLDSGGKRPLTSPQPPVLLDANPVVSPDGRSMVFQRYPTGGGAELHWLSLKENMVAGGEPRLLTAAALNALSPAWMPGGQEILFSAEGGLWKLATSGEGLPERLPFIGENGFMPVISHPQAGRAARLIYVRRFEDRNIWRVETSAPGSPPSLPATIAISSTRTDIQAQFSPVGNRVAFVSDRSGEAEIWLADHDGSNAVKLTSLGARNTGSPSWSPDGQTIVFDSNLEGQADIYVVPASGGTPRRLTSHPANDIIGRFSRDGKWIYFNSHPNGEREIWKIPATGGEAVQMTHNGGWAASESPDGAFLYYTQTSGPAPSALWRIPTSGGQPVKVLEGVFMRAFEVLERGIYHIERSGPGGRLKYFDFASARSTVIVPDLGDVSLYLTASRDGRTILFSRRDSAVDDLMLVEDFR